MSKDWTIWSVRPALKVYDYKWEIRLEIQVRNHISFIQQVFIEHILYVRQSGISNTAISKNGHSSYLHGTYDTEGSLILNKLANKYNMQM